MEDQAQRKHCSRQSCFEWERGRVDWHSKDRCLTNYQKRFREMEILRALCYLRSNHKTLTMTCFSCGLKCKKKALQIFFKRLLREREPVFRLWHGDKTAKRTVGRWKFAATKKNCGINNKHRVDCLFFLFFRDCTIKMYALGK